MDRSALPTGHAQNPELSEVQQQLSDILGYFGKIGLTVSLTEANVRVEQPNGLETFMEELEKARGEHGFVNKDTWNELEDHYRYETIRKPIGNQNIYTNALIRMITARPEFEEFINNAMKESLGLAQANLDLKTATGKQDTDLI